MNIPRQFYGINYISRLVGNFQDTPIADCSKLEYRELDGGQETHLVRKNTRQLGLRAEVVSGLLKKLISDRRCALDGIAIAKGDSLLFAGYRPPYGRGVAHITNSTCKTIIAIGVMFAVSEELLRLEDKVVSFFPEYETRFMSKYQQEMKVEHLLTMSSGSKCNELISVLEDNWVKAFLLTECQYEPGTKFSYNSMNTYMLAAILTKVTGKSVMEYMNSRFFFPLGIANIKWELCPQGIERGGWGLHLSLEDMLKVGIFLANDGAYRGVRLIHPSFIRTMKMLHIRQESDRLSVGYGYQLWHLPRGFYMLSGMYGQHVIIDDVHKLVVATNAHSDKMYPDSPLVRHILKTMDDARLYQPEKALGEDIAYYRLMKEFAAFCDGKQPHRFLTHGRQMAEAERKLLMRLSGRRLHMEQPFKLFPYMMQGMYRFPPFPVSDIAVKMQEDTVKLCFYKERTKKEKKEHTIERLVLEAGLDTYHHQIISIGENRRSLAVKVSAAKDEDKTNVLLLDIVFPDAGSSRVIKLFFTGQRLTVECQEFPDMKGIMEQALYGEEILSGNVIDLTDKLPESLKLFLNQKVEPRLMAHYK